MDKTARAQGSVPVRIQSSEIYVPLMRRPGIATAIIVDEHVRTLVLVTRIYERFGCWHPFGRQQPFHERDMREVIETGNAAA